MKKSILLITLSAVTASSLFADATSIETALANGKTNGEFNLYTKNASNGGTTEDFDYTLGSTSLNFTTASLNGFKGNLGFMAMKKLDSSGDVGFDNAPSTSLNLANIDYEGDQFTLIAGRQTVNLEWISDYHEAVVGVIKTIPNISLIVGHTSKFAGNTNDAPLEKFEKIGNHGANVIDVTYGVDEATKINVYYMDAQSLFSAIGVGITSNINEIGIVAKYALTDEDRYQDANATQRIKDGSIMALDISYNLGEIALNGGYITTDSKGGTGSISALGDNINPLDSGNQVYTTDAKTLYVGANTTVAGFELGGIYGTTDYKYDDNGVTKKGDESELNLTASWECKFVKNLKINALYADISGEVSENDSSYYSLQAVYSF